MYYNLFLIIIFKKKFVQYLGETSSLESLEISKDLAIAIIWASFTFLLIVYLLNLFIGLLTNSIEIKDKRKYILAQKAEVSEEFVVTGC